MMWSTRQLGQIADLLGGGTPKRRCPEYFGRFIDWVTPSDLPPIGTVALLGKTAEGLSEQGLQNSSARRIPAGSVLFSSRASIGKIAVTDRECATNQGFAALVPKPGMVDPWFLAYLLCRYTGEITALAGETTYKEVNRSKLRDFEVHLPLDVAEQRRIVNRIQECVVRIQEMQLLRATALKEATTIESAVFGDVIESWNGAARPREVQLGSILLGVQYGTSVKANNQQRGIPILRMGNIQNGALDTTDLKHIELNARDVAKYRLEDGDILINRTNSLELVGKAALFTALSGDWVFASYLIRLIVDTQKALPAYITTVINSRIGRDYILRTARRAIGMVNVNAQEIRRLPIPLPGLTQQEEIVERANAAKAIARQLRSEMDLIPIESLPRAILRKAFAGEL